MSANPARIPEQAQGSDQYLAATNDASGHKEQHFRLAGGVGPADVSGAIVASTTTIGGATDYSSVGNLTVTFRGTHTGVNLTFEASDDGGTNWYPVAGAREDNSIAQLSTGVLATNSSYSWTFSLYGFDRFRVRATAWTSGTANLVTISAGTLPFEPIVSAIVSPSPTRVDCTFGTVTAGVAGSTTEALISLTPVRDAVAGSAATNHSPTAGKSLWIESMSITVANTAATQNGLFAFLRAVPTGTVTATSPIIGYVGISAANAVSGGMGAANLMVNRRIPAGWNFGVSVDNAINSGTNWVYVHGYEY
jgi:hypothetical protein